MKRKLVKQGRNALTVTLPASYTKRFYLKAGDEVEVEESNKNIIIGGQGEAESKRSSIDASIISPRILRWMLSGLHKSGWNEIEILYKEKETLDTINDLVKNLMLGFAVVEQTDSRYVLKRISKVMESEFDSMLRRAFLVTVSMGDSCIEAIKNNKLEDMKNLISLEKTNNQLTNFCERILNKKGYHKIDKSHFMYVIAWNIEKACDQYKYICQFLSKNPKKMSKETIDIFEQTNQQVRGYSSLLTKFKQESLVELHEKRKKVIKDIDELIKNKPYEEIMILNHLSSLVMICEDFSTTMFALNYG